MPITTPATYITASIIRLRLTWLRSLNSIARAIPLLDTSPAISADKSITPSAYIPVTITLLAQLGINPTAAVTKLWAKPKFAVNDLIGCSK